MSNYNKVQVSYSGQGYRTAIVNYLCSLDDRLTKVDDYTINVDGKFTWLIGAHNASGQWANYLTINGTSHTSSTAYNNSKSVWVESYINDNFMFFNMRSTNTESAYQNNICVVYVSDGAGGYYGGVTTSNATDNDIHSTSFWRVSDGTAGYVFPKMINFSAPAGSVCYSSIAPFANGGSLAFYGAGILSCSTVTAGVTISLPNGKNYIAIGKNAMVEISS